MLNNSHLKLHIFQPIDIETPYANGSNEARTLIFCFSLTIAHVLWMHEILATVTINNKIKFQRICSTWTEIRWHFKMGEMKYWMKHNWCAWEDNKSKQFWGFLNDIRNDWMFVFIWTSQTQRIFFVRHCIEIIISIDWSESHKYHRMRWMGDNWCDNHSKNYKKMLARNSLLIRWKFSFYKKQWWWNIKWAMAWYCDAVRLQLLALEYNQKCQQLGIPTNRVIGWNVQMLKFN